MAPGYIKISPEIISLDGDMSDGLSNDISESVLGILKESVK